MSPPTPNSNTVLAPRTLPARKQLLSASLAIGVVVLGACSQGSGVGALPGTSVNPGIAKPPPALGSGPITPRVPAAVPWLVEFSLPPQDSAGFSSLLPSPDSRIVYVSSSNGQDSTGTTYSPQSHEIGSDPFNPSGSVRAFATIDTALAAVRSGYPDWVLLKRGDAWTVTQAIDAKSGRSENERWLIGAYGPGPERPLIRTGVGQGILFWRNVHYSAAMGLRFYAHQRDPRSSDFVGFNQASNARGFYCWAEEPRPTRSILIEDCAFDFYSNNVVQGAASPRDIIIRRNIITNNYSSSSHAQGLYSKGASILLEENLFDHNGWFKQSYVRLNDKAEGQATFFNHNTYFSNTRESVCRRNLFLRSSSIGNKFTANPQGGTDQIMAADVLLDDNFYIDGEIGISAGGNTDNGDGPRFRNFLIVNNVLMSIGRERPTNRSLGWGIDVDDWDGGRVANNLFSKIGDARVRNVYAINLSGHTNDVEVTGNRIYQIAGRRAALIVDGDPKSRITIRDNRFQLAGTPLRFVETDVTAAGMFSNQRYYTDGNPEPFRAHGVNLDFAGWLRSVGDQGAQIQPPNHMDPDRTVASYAGSQGLAATLEGFIYGAKEQSRQNWRPALTAGALNAYIREGFTGP